MAQVEKRKDESIDKALRKFKMKMRKEGVLDELKRREYFEKPSEIRRHDMEKAKRKEVRRRQEEW
jgi:small subunit ribosomal protein S21